MKLQRSTTKATVGSEFEVRFGPRRQLENCSNLTFALRRDDRGY
jgi:hypothetical protein